MLYNKEDIKRIIPHRDPMLMIDEILEVKENEEGKKVIVGKKVFTGEEGFFKGHFPSLPVVPGVLVLESIAQTGAVYALSLDEYKGKTAFLVGAENVKWRRSVLPKDTLILEVIEVKIRHGIGKCEGKAYVNGALACQAELIVAIQ